MSFPWLETNKRSSGTGDGAARRLEHATRDLRDRAAMLARLGYSAADATSRLQQRVAWDYEPCGRHSAAHPRPDGLSDAAIAQIVTETYQRHTPR